MICMGNICRSPIAEHVMRKKAEDAGLDVHVESAGTGGWHAGEPADHRAQQVLSDNGYTHTHRAQQITPAWLSSFDYLIVMDDNNLESLCRVARADDHHKIALLRSFDEQAHGGAEVPDPYYGTRKDFDDVLEMVERACDGFVAHLRS
jgi:protein-tyrosine phosphatase